MPFIWELTLSNHNKAPFIHTRSVSCPHIDIHLPIDPNSLGIHQPQAPLVNLITRWVWIPLNFLQPAAQAGGPLDGHCSIKGYPMDTKCWADCPKFLEQVHVTLPYKPEPEYYLGSNLLGLTYMLSYQTRALTLKDSLMRKIL